MADLLTTESRGVGRRVIARERPILFTGPMVRAVRDGKKRQTRRVVRPSGFTGEQCVSFRWDSELGLWLGAVDRNDSGFLEQFGCPYGKPGDRLWVRETFYVDHVDALGAIPRAPLPDGEVYYRADGECCEQIPECQCSEYDGKTPWRPSIHMPRWASRITLEVTEVRVERVRDITTEDIAAEGVDNGRSNPAMGVRHDNMQRMAFAELWDSINGKRPGCSWGEDPWVWVVGFRVLDGCAS